MTDPDQAWASYLIPGTDTLRTLPGILDPAAARLYERIVSTDAETTLRTITDRPVTFDLTHLRDIHRRLFLDVYDWAGELRHVDMKKFGQSEPFVHHAWIATYTGAIVDQLAADQNLTHLHDAGQWADRAAHYWAALLHAHPFREGNGRAIRIWMEDLATAAGHTIDWTRTSAARNEHVAIAADNGDLEPIRALLTELVGGTLGLDRNVDALDDFYKLQHTLAWGRTGLVHGSDDDRLALTDLVPAHTARLDTVRDFLDNQDARQASSRDHPPETRWRGLAGSLDPALPTHTRWPEIAAGLDAAARAGCDVRDELTRLNATPPPAPPTTEPLRASGPRR